MKALRRISDSRVAVLCLLQPSNVSAQVPLLLALMLRVCFGCNEHQPVIQQAVGPQNNACLKKGLSLVLQH